MLAIANGVTLTISGPIKAPRRQIFTYTGTGVAVFGNTNYQTWVYPEWTGAGVGVAAATNLDNINNAILLFPAGGSGTSTLPAASTTSTTRSSRPGAICGLRAPARTLPF